LGFTAGLPAGTQCLPHTQTSRPATLAPSCSGRIHRFFGPQLRMGQIGNQAAESAEVSVRTVHATTGWCRWGTPHRGLRGLGLLLRIIAGDNPLLLVAFRRWGRRGWWLGRCGPPAPFPDDVLLDDVRFATRLRRAGHEPRSNTCNSLPGYGQRVSRRGQPSMVPRLSL